MYPVLADFSRVIGYEDPRRLCEQSLKTATAFLVASMVLKCFAPEMKFQSELVFGVTEAVTFNLLWQNKRIEMLKTTMEGGDPLRKDVMNVIFFVVVTMTPIVAARGIHNRFFRPFSPGHSFLRGAYHGVFGLAILYGYGVYQRRAKTLPGP